jgi:hypothetical protein
VVVPPGATYEFQGTFFDRNLISIATLGVDYAGLSEFAATPLTNDVKRLTFTPPIEISYLNMDVTMIVTRGSDTYRSMNTLIKCGDLAKDVKTGCF